VFTSFERGRRLQTRRNPMEAGSEAWSWRLKYALRWAISFTFLVGLVLALTAPFLGPQRVSSVRYTDAADVRLNETVWTRADMLWWILLAAFWAGVVFCVVSLWFCREKAFRCKKKLNAEAANMPRHWRVGLAFIAGLVCIAIVSCETRFEYCRRCGADSSVTTFNPFLLLREGVALRRSVSPTQISSALLRLSASDNDPEHAWVWYAKSNVLAAIVQCLGTGYHGRARLQQEILSSNAFAESLLALGERDTQLALDVAQFALTPSRDSRMLERQKRLVRELRMVKYQPESGIPAVRAILMSKGNEE